MGVDALGGAPSATRRVAVGPDVDGRVVGSLPHHDRATLRVYGQFGIGRVLQLADIEVAVGLFDLDVDLAGAA